MKIYVPTRESCLIFQNLQHSSTHFLDEFSYLWNMYIIKSNYCYRIRRRLTYTSYLKYISVIKLLKRRSDLLWYFAKASYKYGRPVIGREFWRFLRMATIGEWQHLEGAVCESRKGGRGVRSGFGLQRHRAPVPQTPAARTATATCPHRAIRDPRYSVPLASCQCSDPRRPPSSSGARSLRWIHVSLQVTSLRSPHAPLLVAPAGRRFT